MGKSSITWTEGSDWWLSRTTMGGKERYPKQIRVGDLDRPRVYYPIDREALLMVVGTAMTLVVVAGYAAYVVIVYWWKQLLVLAAAALVATMVVHMC